MKLSGHPLGEKLQTHWKALTGSPGALVIRRIEQDIDQELVSRIGELGPRGVPPRNFGSKERRMEWAEGRRCLLLLRDELSLQGANLDKIRSSLSHSHDTVVAVACAPGAEAEEGDLAAGPLKVGVDLEPADRSFHSGVPERIMQESEKTIPLEFLAFWVIKEACYKANPDSKGTVVGQYFVKEYDASSQSGVALCESYPQYDFRFKVLQENGYWVAMAVCQTRN